MKNLKRLVKYFIALINAARFRSALASGKLNGQLLIIMYHRVLPKDDPRLENEEPGMYVTPETLNMHLGELGKMAQMVHIEDWLKLSNENQLEDKLYCAITFDDGWADNYEFAFPLLKKHKTPATIFLATDYIGSSTTFWPERLAKLLSTAKQNDSLYEKLTAFFGVLSTEINQQKLSDKDYIASLIGIAKQLSDDELKSSLNEIEANLTMDQFSREMLTWEEVLELRDAGILIGGHTRSHLRLNEKAQDDRVKSEISGCAEDIESQLGVKPSLFCYPNGDTSEFAVTTVKQHFKVAVTTQTGLNPPEKNNHMLMRVGLHQDASSTSAETFSRIYKAL